ncbi:MAG: hypothetical protein ACXAD7_20850, partial [Candidatus Kariarchaeaceae archaeon]
MKSGKNPHNVKVFYLILILIFTFQQHLIHLQDQNDPQLNNDINNVEINHQTSSRNYLQNEDLEKQSLKKSPSGLIRNSFSNFTSPGNITLEQGNTDYNLTWWIQSNSNPEKIYNLTRDGNNSKFGTFVGMTIQNITIILDNLELGVYNYTLDIYETGGAEKEHRIDTIFVTVQDKQPPIFNNPVLR